MAVALASATPAAAAWPVTADNNAEPDSEVGGWGAGGAGDRDGTRQRQELMERRNTTFDRFNRRFDSRQVRVRAGAWRLKREGQGKRGECGWAAADSGPTVRRCCRGNMN